MSEDHGRALRRLHSVAYVYLCPFTATFNVGVLQYSTGYPMLLPVNAPIGINGL